MLKEILGKIAAEIAVKLMGKHKVSYTPHVDGGDFVIVLNADKFAVTGNKLTDKKYYRHSGFPGGLKVRNSSRNDRQKTRRNNKKSSWKNVTKEQIR